MGFRIDPLISLYSFELPISTALREFNALSRSNTIPLLEYLLDGNISNKQDKSQHVSTDELSPELSPKFDPLASGGNALPVGFRIFIKSKMNSSQLQAITASATEYGAGKQKYASN